MNRKVSLAVTLLVGIVLCWPALCYAEGAEPQAQEETWGSIKAMYREVITGQTMSVEGSVTEALNGLRNAKTEEEALEILESYPEKVHQQIMDALGNEIPYVAPDDPPWSHPLAQEAINKFGINSSDILAIQRVVALDNGVPIDSADVVVTDEQWYYSSLTTGELTSTTPGGFTDTREIDIYGSGVEITTWNPECWNIHWAVTFYMPVCFYELIPGSGVFDGIIDAWAPRPDCSPWCNGGLCALFMCGDAWDGAGNTGWWKFRPFCSDQRASKKLGKVVQKRWLHTWQLCHHRSDADIARSVRARIRY